MQNRRIILVGDLGDPATTLPRWQALAERHLVLPFHQRCGAPRYMHGFSGLATGLLARAQWKLGIAMDGTAMNRELPAVAAAFRPDIVWFEKSNCLRPETLVELHRTSTAKLVSFSLDDMALSHNRTRSFRSCLPLFDLVVTTKHANIAGRELEALGARRVAFVAQGYSPLIHRAFPREAEEMAPWRCDVAFLGAWEAERAAALAHLIENGVPVRVYGGGREWREFGKRYPSAEIRPLAFGADYGRAIAGARIGLCFLRRLNRDTHTSRTFEIPACGAAMVAERTREHEEFFRDGVEALFFETHQELLRHVQWLLSNPMRCTEIARAGRLRCESSGYDYGTRLEGVLEELFHEAPRRPLPP